MNSGLDLPHQTESQVQAWSGTSQHGNKHKQAGHTWNATTKRLALCTTCEYGMEAPRSKWKTPEKVVENDQVKVL